MSEIVGDKITASTGEWHTIGAGGGVNTQALVLLTATQALFVHRLGFWGRRSGGSNGRAQIALWAEDPNAPGQPGALLGYTAEISVGNTAALREAGLVWSNAAAQVPGIAAPAIRLAAGSRFFLGVQIESAGVDIARLVGAPSVTTYRRQTSGNPPNPFGTPTTSVVAQPGLYAVAETNTAPVLTLTGPAASISSATPTLSGTVAEPDAAAPMYDRLNQYEVAVRRVGETNLIWNPIVIPSTAEREAAAFGVVYNGAALSEDAYEWQARGRDDAGAWGAWTAWWPFTLENLGGIDIVSAGPTGKDEDGVIANWTARWTHPLSLAANGAKVRLLSGAVVVYESPLIVLSPTVAANAFITVTGAQVGIGITANRIPSGVYGWQMQGRDTGGNFSPWSDTVALSVNYPPNQPSALRPASGTTLAARPLTDWILSDPDLDDVLGVGLTSMWEITRPDLSTVTYEIGAVNPDTGRGEYQVSASDAASNGTYQWRVRGRDVSAAGTASEYGPWSPPAVFTLVTAPIITVTAPAQNAVIGTSTPQIAWTIADGLQSFFRVQVYRTGQTTPFYSSGQLPVAVPASSGQFSIPAGWLKNGLLYDVEVTIWTAGGITSTSARRTFRVSYADAALVADVTAGLQRNRRDWEPSSVAVAWAATGYPASQFVGYVIWRRPSADDPDTAVPIALVRNPGQTAFVDHHPPPNEPLVYAVSQLRRAGADVQTSPLVEIETEVPLTTPVLASLENGGTVRGAIVALSTGISGGFRRTEAAVETWGSGGKEQYVRPPRGWGSRVFNLNYTLRGDARGTYAEHWRDVEEMVESGDAFSLRTEQHRVFCRIVPQETYWRRGRGLGTVEITLQLREIAWSEAVSLTV